MLGFSLPWEKLDDTVRLQLTLLLSKVAGFDADDQPSLLVLREP